MFSPFVICSVYAYVCIIRMRVLGIYFSFLSSSDNDMKNQVTLNWHNDRAFDFGNAFFFNMKKKMAVNSITVETIIRRKMPPNWGKYVKLTQYTYVSLMNMIKIHVYTSGDGHTDSSRTK